MTGTDMQVMGLPMQRGVPSFVLLSPEIINWRGCPVTGDVCKLHVHEATRHLTVVCRLASGELTERRISTCQDSDVVALCRRSSPHQKLPHARNPKSPGKGRSKNRAILDNLGFTPRIARRTILSQTSTENGHATSDGRVGGHSMIA